MSNSQQAKRAASSTSSDSQAEEPAAKRARKEPPVPRERTLINHDGKEVPTFSWPTTDSIVALRTLPRKDVGESVFFASKSILIRDSPVFETILSFPEPGSLEKNDVYDGFPVIEVQDDPADLQPFLEALHNHREFFQDDDWRTSYEVTAALLRLSTKYDVEPLRQKVISDALHWFYGTSLQSHIGDPCSEEHRAADVNYLNLVKEHGYRPLLPHLVYMCATEWSLKDILDAPVSSSSLETSHAVGQQKRADANGTNKEGDQDTATMKQVEDGKQDQGGADSANTQDDPAIEPETSALTLFDEALRFHLVKVQAATASWFTEILLSLLDATTSCPKSRCRASITTLGRKYCGIGPAVRYPDLLDKSVYPLDELCKYCKRKADAQIAQFMEKVWDVLPSVIGLPEWSKLKEEAVPECRY